MTADAAPRGLVQGTLQMLILKTLTLEPLHGYGIGVRLEQISGGGFLVNAGSLFPGRRGGERDGGLGGEWGVSENNRRARFYQLTAAGKRKLAAETSRWRQMTRAIGLILGEEAD